MKYLLYLIGCIIFSLGATFFISSNLGTDPLDVFCIGIQNVFDLKIGTIQSLFAVACLGSYAIIKRTWKMPFSSFLTFFACGYMIDFFRYIQLHSGNHTLDMILGLVSCLEGSALILMSTFGVRAMDMVSIALQEKTEKPFWLYKGVIETLLLITGYLLGGPVGIGTVLFLVCVGWGIYPTIKLNKKILGFN